ncbi:MAG TPA: hypothetical protein VFC07_07280, partial [Verrucomicrobiae bacterium]|nr:hypothetical protein [Verrucomicrobiae bacterium]
FKSRPKSLAKLMEVGVGHPRLWRPDELAAIFRHQMSAPVLVDLGGFDPGTAVKLRILSEAQGLLLKSFADLFHHPSPPLELLELTKDFAKANLDHPESSLPNEIATALYYTCIATALVRLDKRISQLDDESLRRGLLWVKEQGWIDEEIQALLVKAMDKLLPAGGKGGATS